MMSPSRAGRRRPSEINLPQKSPTKIEPWTPRRRRPRKACVDRPFVRACSVEIKHRDRPAHTNINY